MRYCVSFLPFFVCEDLDEIKTFLFPQEIFLFTLLVLDHEMGILRWKLAFASIYIPNSLKLRKSFMQFGVGFWFWAIESTSMFSYINNYL